MLRKRSFLTLNSADRKIDKLLLTKNILDLITIYGNEMNSLRTDRIDYIRRKL